MELSAAQVFNENMMPVLLMVCQLVLIETFKYFHVNGAV